MRQRIDRVRGLIRRYRTDRRLPPVVRRLYTDVARLRQRDLFERQAAATTPILRSSTVSDPVVARLGRRRIETAGRLPMSLHDHAHDQAESLLDVWRTAGIDAFIVRRARDHIELGVPLEQRGPALDALRQLAAEPGWYVRLGERTSADLHPVVDAVDSGDARRARAWHVHRAWTWGGRAVGHDQAVGVSFWELGTSGQLELVGTRGHHRFDPTPGSTTEVVEGHVYPGRRGLPVARDAERFEEAVDVVYTWVDNGDADWRARFSRWAGSEGRATDDSALDPARFASNDELRYSLRSLWAFGGWVRNVYIVTGSQVPAWFRDDARVRIVDHAEILPAAAIPTFNSHAIESALHRIDGLSEHFVYLNDDVFLGRSSAPSDYFTANGLARLFQSGARIPDQEQPEMRAYDTAAIRGRELLFARFGRMFARKPLHAPFALRRSVLFDVDEEFEAAVTETRLSRFRSPSDVSVAASLGPQFAFLTGRGVISDHHSDYVHSESARLDLHLTRLRLARDFDSFCINATFSGAPGQQDRDRRIGEFLEECFPIPSPWESAE